MDNIAETIRDKVDTGVVKDDTGGGNSYIHKIAAAMNLFNERQYEGAIDASEEALRQEPERAEAYLMLGVIAYQYGKTGQALQMIEKAQSLDPECRDYAEALANIYTRVGRLNDGLYYAKLAGTLAPHAEIPKLVPQGLSNYFKALAAVSPSKNFLQAVRLYGGRKYAATVEFCEAELAINRDHTECWRLLGRTLIRIGKFERAIATYHSLIHLEPDNAEDRMYLGDALCKLGRFSEALSCHAKARQLAPDNADIYAHAMKGLAYQDDEIWKRYRKQATDWSKKHVVSRQDKQTPDKGPTSDEPGRKIRIGYLSNRFFNCAESIFLEPVIKYHDPKRFDIYCYQNFSVEDSGTTRMKNHAKMWRNISDIDPVTASYTLEGDQIDILVDLSTDGEDSKLELLGTRPARALVGWLGQLQVNGGIGTDVILSDSITAKVDAKSRLKDQKTVVLDRGLLSADVPSFTADVSEAPVQRNGGVTLGGVCDLARLNSTVVAVWSDVLNAIPSSRLFLGCVDGIAPEVKARAFEMFAHFGVTDRIVFQDYPEDQKEPAEMNFFANVDLLLDTFPNCGVIDTCLALWMGVPVITLTGNRRSGLMGASILNSAGKGDWITNSKKQYLAKAVELTKDADELANLRRNLRAQVKESQLFKPQEFVRSLERAYLEILGQ